MGESGCGGVVEGVLGDWALPGSFIYDMWWLVVGVGGLLVVCGMSLLSAVFPSLGRVVKQFSRYFFFFFFYVKI